MEYDSRKISLGEILMNLLERAKTSITRQPVKSLVLLMLIFILGTLTAGAIAVNGAINNTDANLRRNMQPILSLTFDHASWSVANDLPPYYRP